MTTGLLRVATFLGAALAAALGAASPGVAQDKPLKKVVVVASHQQLSLATDVYFYAVPFQLGYFKQEGIEVEYVLSSGSAAAVQLVVGGKADIGTSNPGPIFNAILKGAPLKSFYLLSPAYTSGLAVLEDSPIKSPRDLKPGMLVGVASLASGHVPAVRAMIRELGFKPDEDIKMVAVGTGAQATAALQSGRVQAIYLWDLAYNAITARGVNLRIMRDVFPNAERILDGVQFASNDYIAKNPDVIAGIGRAQAKAIIWSYINPGAALELFYKTFPDAKPRNDEIRKSDLEVFRRNVAVDAWREKGAKKFGEFKPENVAFTVKFLSEIGEMPAAPDPTVLYTNAFVDRANDFSIEQIEAAAKQAK